MMRPVLTREEYMKLRDGGRQKEILAAVRAGNAEMKTKLVQMNYSCIPGEDGLLKGCKTASMSVGMDIDHVAKEEMEPLKERILGKKDELGLLMLEKSARGEGYHLVFRRKADLSQEENLKWASDLLGVQFDDGAKDITRVFFTTTANESDQLFLDDELFSTERCSCCSCCSSNSPTLSTDSQLSTLNSQLSYNGIPYADIVRKYWEMFNEGKEPMEGDRNVKTFELAVTLRSICDYSLEKMMQIVPNYWGDNQEEWRKTLENALKEPRKGMPYRLRQVLAALKSTCGVKACGGTLTTPPPMPKRLPALIKHLTKNVPWYYKPAVANAVFPALGAHLHGVKFLYMDNNEHEGTFMNVLIGRQSVGKGCIKKPIEYVMEDIRKRDIPNRKREAEWKQKNPTARQRKDPRPTDICIQMLIDNMTDAVFNQRVVDAHNNGQRYIYSIVDEIEALKKVTSKGTTDEVGLLIRKAFDNSMAGQDRVGADSVSGIAPLRWNFNASTTPPNARKFFYKMVNDGTVSRLDIATIMIPEDDDSIPVMGVYDEQFAAELKPYIDRLEAAGGLIECPQARRLAQEMDRENKDVYKLLESEAYRVFSYRANVIAWLKGMVLYVAQGYKWDKTIAEFVRWTYQYNMWCKMLYFGQQLEKEQKEEIEIMRQSGPQNLLELLPDEFTKEQYRQMRANQGRDGNGDSTIRVWQKRGYICFDEVFGTYCKTSKYKEKYESVMN